MGDGNQIDYQMFGGKKIPHDEISSKDWRDDYTKQLTGKVYSIAVGQKESIALAEGCSWYKTYYIIKTVLSWVFIFYGKPDETV